MFALICIFASLPLAILAAGAAHEVFGERFAARRRRRERYQLRIRAFGARIA